MNVEAQAKSLSSPLNWMKRMIAVRKTSQVFGRGSLTFIRPANRSVLVYAREYNNEVVLCVSNLSRTAQAVEVDLSQWKGRIPVEMMGRSRFKKIGDAPFVVTLAPYGFFWFLLCEETGATAEPTQLPEWVTLVFSDGWRSLLEGHSLRLFEREVLPPFLASRRWFADKNSRSIQAPVAGAVPLSPGHPGTLLTILDVECDSGPHRYALPLALHWSRVERTSEQGLVTLVAPIRRGAREGALVDAAADPALVTWMIHQIHGNTDVESEAASFDSAPPRRSLPGRRHRRSRTWRRSARSSPIRP